MISLEDIPHLLRDQTHHNLQALLTSFKERNLFLPEHKNLITSLPIVFACSQWVADNCVRHPELLFSLINSNDLWQIYNSNDYSNKFREKLFHVNDEIGLIKTLREIRQLEFTRIAWRDLAGWANLTETVTDLSNFADACLEHTLIKLCQWQCDSEGVPLEHCTHQLAIIALGKLGSRELNFSSDIDLVFCFDQRKPKNYSIPEGFFKRLIQRFLKVINFFSADGFVFRVDLRLRPFGNSGPLVNTVTALEDYFRLHGRDWERYAFAKARVISHSDDLKKQVTKIIADFVYRPYIDYSVIGSLRELKQKIKMEARHAEDDIKRCEGGIREVEFIVQVFQLIRGGKELEFRKTSQFELLPILKKKHCLPKEVVDTLTQNYIFFRRVEHRLQEYHDQQTHRLPADEQSRCRLAFSMGFPDWQAFAEFLQSLRKSVVFHFEQTIAIAKPIPEYCQLPAADKSLEKIFSRQLPKQEKINLLTGIGFIDAEIVYESLTSFLNNYHVRMIDNIGHRRLEKLLPQLLLLITKYDHDAQLAILNRLLRLLESTVRRSVYIVLLLENLEVLPDLIELIAISSWLAEMLAQFPFLLEELIRSDTLYAPLKLERLANELRQSLLSVAEDDLENQMEWLRRFKHIQVLHVAIADLKEILPLNKVGEHLTNTASVIINFARDIAWNYLIARHGYPCAGAQVLSRNDFAIIGYGKLGSYEMHYESDLDLVFLHVDVEGTQLTDGAKPITNKEFFIRLAQRIIHILNTSMTLGILYRVDTRLRPSGRAGLLVSSITGFADYQKSQAWMWEHQALVRARLLCGSAELNEKFSNLRKEILHQSREQESLRHEIIAMRSKMRASLVKSTEEYFDFDQDEGGIKDIEFIAQYFVLRDSHRVKAISEHTRTSQILQSLEKFQLLAEKDGNVLLDAYWYYRQLQYRKILQGRLVTISDKELFHHREGVKNIWQKIFEESLA